MSLLHKEGAAALGKLVQGAGVGRLGAEGTPAEELAEGGHTVAAFVCHPQAWYLALWRRGCEGKGALYARLTDESRWARLGRQKAPRAGRSEARSGRAAGQAAPANWSAEHARQVWYGQPDQPQAFREWLQAVLGHPATRRLVGASGGLLKSSRWSGLMTREYVETFLARSGAGAIAPETVKDLLALDAQKNQPLLFIRAEHQASDTQAALAALGVALPPAQAAALAALGDAGLADLARYFDDESRALVAKHEKFILRRFGYAGASDSADDPADGAAKPKRKRAGAVARRKAKTDVGDDKKAARKRKKAQGRGDSATVGAVADAAATGDRSERGERSAERAAERSAGRATRRASKRAAAPSADAAQAADPAAEAAAPAGKVKAKAKDKDKEAKAGKSRSSKAKASSKAQADAGQSADRPDTEDLID